MSAPWIETGNLTEKLIQVPDRVFIIAEAGINHNGDIEVAKKLIDMAADSGCDAIKFQKRTIDIVYSKEVLDSPRESPWGSTQRDQKNGLEFDQADYMELDRYCKEKGITWSASAWDIPSLDFIEKFNPEFHKVASAMITHSDFLRRVAEIGKPTLISTGMADLLTIDKAVDIFTKSNTEFALLHTVSTYPSKEEDLNLLMMLTLRERYGVPVGYSGHEASVSPSLAAACLGAVVIERHVTLDRSMYGSDQSASLEESGLRQLCSSLRKLPAIMGDGVKVWADGELEVAKKLRYWEEQ